MTAMSSVRLKAAGMLAGLSLLLSGCFLQAGTFTSKLVLLSDNEFTFTYEGEIYILGLAQLMEEQRKSQTRERTFEAYCYGPEPEAGDEVDGAAEAAADAVEDAIDPATAAAEEAAEFADEAAADAVEAVSDVRLTTVEIAEDSEYGSRECTAEEDAEQRLAWEEREVRRLEREKDEMEQFSKIFGGIDPTDPDVEKELANRLERQEGFDKVVSKGDGLFEVSYSISGTLTHDFMFPMMEGFPTNAPFVQALVRNGNVVRINAPAFANPSNGNPMFMYLLGAPGFGSSSNRDEFFKHVPAIDGTFTIITDGEIRANNTDEGPASKDGRQELTWTINARTTAAPTALIAMPE